MIEVTKMNGRKVLVNPDLIELVEETPDTVVLFTTGRKIIIKESRQEVKNLVKSYRKDIFADYLNNFLFSLQKSFVDAHRRDIHRGHFCQ